MEYFFNVFVFECKIEYDLEWCEVCERFVEKVYGLGELWEIMDGIE